MIAIMVEIHYVRQMCVQFTVQEIWEEIHYVCEWNLCVEETCEGNHLWKRNHPMS